MDYLDASELPLESIDKRARDDNGRAFSDHLSTLLLVFGSGLVLFHIVTWIAVIIEPFREEAGIPSSAPQVNTSFWRIVADGAFRTSFFYLILGVVLILVAVHLKNTPGWNRIILPLVCFIALNVVIMTLGFFAAIFIPEASQWQRELSFYSILNSLELLVKIIILIAIMIVEVPRVRNRLVQLFRRGKVISEQVD